MKLPRFSVKLFIILTTTFILMTIIGTLTHELGHYSAARILGYESQINYMSARDNLYEKNKPFIDSLRLYQHELKNNLDFPEKERIQKKINTLQRHNLWIIMGGPIQTMLTGTIGFVLLLWFRKKWKQNEALPFKAWVLVFLSLFWLRQPANLFTGLFSYFKNGEILLRGDEFRLAHYFGWNLWSILLVTGLMGLFVLYKVLMTLPYNNRLTFLLSGLLGGVLGYYLWLFKFGVIVMP